MSPFFRCGTCAIVIHLVFVQALLPLFVGMHLLAEFVRWEQDFVLHRRDCYPVTAQAVSQETVFARGEYGYPSGQRGFWKDEQTFVLDYDRISNHNAYVMQMHFEDGRVEIASRERSRSDTAIVKGTAQAP